MGKVLNNAMSREGWLTLSAARDRLGISIATVYRWVKSGRLATRMVAGKQFVSLASVEAALGAEGRQAMGQHGPTD